ncbi:ROK family protein [Flavihumibacter rivuli]|uniref:ROK family protein n=1 Tax=Flavihumibacter rivuli TaxID=2838156 RepID=UPI001BDE4CFD|nr:ROK family protein [Flavihumibacter rivuli]ULQ58296.1 ROK family protein [Flavihumibacter rivuli]
MSQPIWGIDLGGTKIEGVILPSLGDPKPIVRTRVDTEAHLGYDHIVGQIALLVDNMKQQSGLFPSTIGFGTPGVLDPILRTMKNCNSTQLNGKPLQDDIENALGIPVKLANDANCFALAETHWGVVKHQFPEARMVFGIIMGTGVGGGIVHEGKVWNGKHGIAGEWGHIHLDDSGGPCYCGRTGCVETILSGPSLQRYYKQSSGKDKTLKEIVAQAAAGNEAAARLTIDRLNHFFGRAVSIITNLLDPDVIIVGGGVGNIDSIYSEGVRSLQYYIFNNRLDVPVTKPMLGDSAGVFGAAALVAS